MIRWNHTVRVYRAVPIGGGAFGWEAQDEPTRRNARPDYSWGGGQQAVGDLDGSRRMWFLRADVDVAEGDVLDATEGPEAPTRAVVLSVSRPARASVTHHIEVLTERFAGSLP